VGRSLDQARLAGQRAHRGDAGFLARRVGEAGDRAAHPGAGAEARSGVRGGEARMRRARGQAAVETALTLPLFLFMILGTLQLFLMLQARLMAEHAVFAATRTGALSSGRCTRMKHAALLTLLPTFVPVDSPVKVSDAFGARVGNHYVPASDSNHDGEILWLFREVPGARGLPED